MRFVDFPLYDAIFEVRQQMILEGHSPGEEAWYVDADKRFEFTRRVVTQMALDCDQTIINAAIAFRKCPKAEGSDIKKLDLLLQVARLHGRQCFYANRGLGLCSEEVHLDRLVPGARGGVYSIENCVISCGFHNSSKNDKSLEEYLLSARSFSNTR